MANINWADDGEDEIGAALINELQQKDLERKDELSQHVDAIEEILNKTKEFCQIGLVMFKISCQKTINIYRQGKEDREYGCSLLMNKVMRYLHNNVKTEHWQYIVTSICELFEEKVKGTLLLQAKNKHIKTENILPLRVLERNHIRNRKLYFDRKGCNPPIDCDD